MTCKSALLLVEANIDGELDAANKADIERHLDECPECRKTHRRIADLGADLRALALTSDAPDDMEARVLRVVRKAAAENPRPLTPNDHARRQFSAWAIAATLLLAVSVGWNVVQLRSHQNTGEDLTGEIVSSHIRSLIGNHLMDVASTDQHTVKPWFNGKLEYAPPVQDFAASSFPLAGGRVDYVDGRPVAALVYKRQQHVINLFIWPSTSIPEITDTELGFHLVAWSKAGMSYCAVSDLNPVELRQFADLFK